MSVPGKLSRTTNGAMGMGPEVGGNTEKRPRSAALEIELAADLKVVKDPAQWRNPEFKPEVEAHQSSVEE